MRLVPAPAGLGPISEAYAVASMSKLAANTEDDIICTPVWPSIAVELAYYRSLIAPINTMAAEFMDWATTEGFTGLVRKAMALDASPADRLRKSLDEFAKHWTGRWATMEERIAQQFAKGAWTATDNGMRASFKKAGFTIQFKLTKPMLLAYSSRVQTNVNLIRSIPQQYLKDISQKVWDTVTTSGDMNKLTEGIQDVYGATIRRAAFIARDQNNKAKASFEQTRRIELGIEEAEWQHSNAGKEPRPTHLKAGRQRVRFSIKQGWLDPEDGEHIQPGEKINCRCTSRAIISGLRRRKP